MNGVFLIRGGFILSISAVIVCYLKSTNYAVVIGISESKLDDSFLSSEIQIDNYNILRCDWNRHGCGVDCYIRNDLSFDVKSFCQPEIENTSFKILLPNMKPTVVRIIYRPPSQSKCLEIINTRFSNLDTNNNEIYILGDFNINLYLNNSYIIQKIICFKAKRFLATSKNTSLKCLVLNN